MQDYRLTALVTCTATTVVRAESLKEAIKLSTARTPTLGYPGSGANEETDWVVDAADGEPTNISEE
jgi:hypothetical protein